jgi:hypothetical protein
MSAEDNLSKELFFNVHRGVAVGSEGVDQKRGVGMHWSADKAIAEDFAVDNNEPGRTKPYVIHAEVPLSSVETHTGTLNKKNVGGVFSGENEVPVGRGNQIRITGRTTLRQDKTAQDVKKNRNRYPKSRTRTYNPPREATA